MHLWIQLSKRIKEDFDSLVVFLVGVEFRGELANFAPFQTSSGEGFAGNLSTPGCFSLLANNLRVIIQVKNVCEKAYFHLDANFN